MMVAHMTGTLVSQRRQRTCPGMVLLFLLSAAVPVRSGAEIIALNATRKLPVPTQNVNGEWLAPIVGILSEFGVKSHFESATKSLTLESSDGRTAVLTVGKSELVTGASKLKLNAPPGLDQGNILLPVSAVARWLGLSFRLTEKGDIELNHGVLDLNVRESGEKFVVEVHNSGPTQYTYGRLSEPDRLYVDIKQADLLVTERNLTVGHALVKSVRAGQFSKHPDVTRVVVDLAKACEVAVTGGSSDPRIKIVLSPVLSPKEGPPLRTTSSTPASGTTSSRGALPGRGLPGARLVLTPSRGTPVKWEELVIVVDAGHGGKDPGAEGTTGIHEKDLALDIAKKLASLLQSTGAKVVLTRSDDIYLKLAERVEIAQKEKANLFISVHINSAPTPNKLSGTEVYYYTEQSLPFAQHVHESMIGELGLKDGGIRQRRFYVIRHTTMPAILTETAYINNTKEEKLLNTPEFRQKAASAIYSGIRSFVLNVPLPTTASGTSTVIPAPGEAPIVGTPAVVPRESGAGEDTP
ncbi:MAG: N-acetylmuramoyl-L-alanine amidase [Armatimonadetes bacterium]|nr:N-acetylmuramoyl-L-alanine amidase [Armatimonadota bacterium]